MASLFCVRGSWPRLCCREIPGVPSLLGSGLVDLTRWHRHRSKKLEITYSALNVFDNHLLFRQTAWLHGMPTNIAHAPRLSNLDMLLDQCRLHFQEHFGTKLDHINNVDMSASNVNITPSVQIAGHSNYFERVKASQFLPNLCNKILRDIK